VGPSGVVHWTKAQAWIEPWSRRIDPEKIILLGGEPLLHPELREWLLGIQQHFPESKRILYTNGLALARKPDLYSWLIEAGTDVTISIHSETPAILEQIKDGAQDCLFSKSQWTCIENIQASDGTSEHMLFESLDKIQLRLKWMTRMSGKGRWTKKYQGVLDTMRPFQNNDPNASYESCSNQIWSILVAGRLFKCASAGLLKSTLESLKLTEIPEWQEYLQYEGLGMDCSQQELESFVRNVGMPHPMCRMCPAHPIEQVHSTLTKTKQG
jgi:hypothetical protein